MPAFPRPRPLPPRRRAEPAAFGPAGALPQAPRASAAPGHAPPAPEPTDIEGWFARRGWTPFEFQREVWQAVDAGESGLLHATTGAGKTYAVWFAALAQALAARPAGAVRALSPTGRGRGAAAAPAVVARPPWSSPGLKLLWVTPMRALASDTRRALAEPLPELGLDWQVGQRTGDTPSAERARQDRWLPEALVTTPESLSLMLARADSPVELGRLAMVVVDEWHELMGNKRGVQLQLALARLRRFNPGLVVWGLSATLGNVDEALAVLLPGAPAAGAAAAAAGGSGAAARARGRLVRGRVAKDVVVDTLLPESTGRFPWAGHLGIRMLDPVVREIEASASTLVFTNTRSQAELWYRALLEARPDWAGLIALHHGSLDREVRAWVEGGLKEGRLKAVVCTSSLDLGVDFSPVERVLQVGSAKGVARLLQRAGRSGHAPGRVSRVTLVPTHALELIEAAAAQDAVAARRVEARATPARPLDVLVQHLVTVALGTGFVPGDLLAEVRSAHAYRELTDEEFAWALDFVTRGGASLAAYPEFRRVVPDAQGVHRVPDHALARRHRMSVGTIVADASMQVRYLGGGSLGTIEEGFIRWLRAGDRFHFAGRLLELVRVHEMTAWVKRATGSRGAVPRWAGGRMPLSSEMADAVLDRLARAARGEFAGPEMRMARPLLELQSRWSALPGACGLLVERLRSREGEHVFVYPFAGRHVHVGLASLLAWRVSQGQAATFSIAVNDYGFELLAPEPLDWGALRDRRVFAPDGLLDHVLASLNAGELAQRRFREIARVSGLVFQGFPGAVRSTRQLQASSGLFYEVFRKHDAGNLLLTQADREVLVQELDLARLAATLERIAAQPLRWVDIERPTPFAFPLMVERFREKLSTEKLSERIARMLKELEMAAEEDRREGGTVPRRGGARRGHHAVRGGGGHEPR